MVTLPFTYKNGNSFLHKTPSWIKILFIPALSAAVLKSPFYVAAVFCLLQIALASFLRFTIKEQLKDLAPAVFYAVLLYSTNFLAHWASSDLKESFVTVFKNKETLFMLLKLFCLMQASSLVFRTSTTLQIREGIGTLESALRKILPVSKKNSFTNMLSLFICFIPLVFKNWNQCSRTWKTRAGKRTLRMYLTLLPVFFSTGIKQAWNMARAVEIREG